MARSGCEQRRQQLDRFRLLGSGERLEPRRLEHDLIARGYCTQRYDLAAATEIRFQHSVSEIAPPILQCAFPRPFLTSGWRDLRDPPPLQILRSAFMSPDSPTTLTVHLQ